MPNMYMELKSVPSSLSESNRSRRSVPGSEEGVSHPAPNLQFLSSNYDFEFK